MGTAMADDNTYANNEIVKTMTPVKTLMEPYQGDWSNFYETYKQHISQCTNARYAMKEGMRCYSCLPQKVGST